MASSEALARFLREAVNWRWDEFVLAEKNKEFSTNQSIIFALIRACATQNLPAIKIALRRIDGNLKTPIKIEMPKVFYLFPNAPDAPTHPLLEPGTITENPATAEEADRIIEGQIIERPEPVSRTEEKPDRDLPSMGLRETLQEMAEYPRSLPEAIVELALQTEQHIKKTAPAPNEIPKVKSVVAAHLLIMAQNRNIDALTEVFDQIDGKLVETLQIIGEDIYITSYSEILPENAILNEDGIWQAEAIQAQSMWAEKLGQGLKHD